MPDRGLSSSVPASRSASSQAAPAFKLRVYSRKWGHDDTYSLTRTDSGWEIHFIQIGGACDPTGVPYLFNNLEHDEIRYPPDLGQRLHRLWREVPMMTREEVQSRLDIIAGHLRAHEKSSGLGKSPAPKSH